MSANFEAKKVVVEEIKEKIKVVVDKIKTNIKFLEISI